MNFIVDSSVFIASLLPTETHHKISVDFFNFLGRKDSQIILPWTVVLEIGNVLTKYGQLLKQYNGFNEFFEQFDQYRLLPIDEITASKILYYFDELNLKTADAIVGAAAVVNSATLISWDRQLVAQTSQFASAYTPKEFLKL